MTKKTSILLLYTGGTIGMVEDIATGALQPFDLGKIYDAVPVLSRLDCQIESYTFDPIIDSSDMSPRFWLEVARVIEENYHSYDSFVVLHGTDTMSFTASALSFLFENLDKPIVLTGSQLPLGRIRTDGIENIVGSVEIASNKKASLPEVCICFEDKLFRGNRTTKINSEYFEAFVSGNYPSLAKIGIQINYKENLITPKPSNALKVYKKLDDNIVILKLYPGIKEQTIRGILGIEGLKGVVLETYGSGNAPTDDWFINALREAIEKGIIIFNVTQCQLGAVHMGKYATSCKLREIGVKNGYDITTESAVAKMMFLLGNYSDKKQIEELLEIPLRGEMTISEEESF